MGDISVFRVMTRWTLPELFKLLSWIRQTGAKIVHIQYNAAIYNNHIMINLLPFFIKSFLRGVKVVITFHEMTGPGIFWKLWLRICLRYTDRIIMTNKKYADILLKESPSSLSKISVIPVGSCLEEDLASAVTQEECASLRRGLNVDAQTFLIVYFGLIFPNRELEVLIRAVKSVIEEGRKVKLILIGGTSDIFSDLSARYKNKIDQCIAELSGEEFITRLGFLDSAHISKIMRCCEMVVSLYKSGVHAGCGSFIAALSCGLPVITTMADVPTEGLIHYQNALLLRNNNPEELKGYMLELINDRALRERLSCGARALFKGYTWEAISLRTIAVYNSLKI